VSERGHPALGGLFGLLLGVFLAVDLLLLGAFRLDSPLVVILPVLLLVVGIVAGLFAPLKMLRRS
jgi:hypothetical protein